MKPIFVITLAVLLVISACSPGTKAPLEETTTTMTAIDTPHKKTATIKKRSAHTPPKPTVQTVAAGNNEFALELYQLLAADNGNLFFSPFSLSAVLAMTYAGAAGDTELQMAKGLHFGSPQQEFHRAFSSLNKTVNQAKGVQIKVANAIWPSNTAKLENSFLKQIENHYQAPITLLDYNTSLEPARQTINK